MLSLHAPRMQHVPLHAPVGARRASSSRVSPCSARCCSGGSCMPMAAPRQPGTHATGISSMTSARAEPPRAASQPAAPQLSAAERPLG